MTGSTTTVGIEVRADGTQKAARDLADVDAAVRKIGTDLGGTAQPAGVAAQGLEQLGAAGRSAGAGLGTAGQSAGAAAPKLSGVGTSAKKAAEGLGSVSKFASTAKFDKVVSDLGAMGVKLNTNSLHAQKLAKAMQQVERERAFQQLAADANLSTLKLAKFRAELGDTRGALATLTNGFGLSKAAVLAFAAALAFGGKAALDAALQMDRLSKAYTTITGSSSAAQAQLGYLYDVSNRLGLQFQSTTEAAKTFFAAGKGSTLEKDMNGIFEAVASAGSALSLSTDDMHGAFIALGQMISKGKVQAEELRGQLGERLPGAFQLAAKAMNMTTAELDKFMADGKLTAEELLPKLAKVMKEDFGAAAEAAANGLQGQLNRLSTEWTRLKASMVDSDSVAAVFKTLAEALKTLADSGETVATVVGKGLQWVAWSAGVYAFIKSISGLITVFQTLKTVAGAVSFASIATAAGPVAAALGLVAVAVGSVVMEQDKGEEIGKRYASVSSDIEAALKKQAQAAKDARDSTDRLSQSQQKLSVSQAIEDQAEALQKMQSLSTGKGWLEMLGIGGDSDEAVAKIKEKTVELLTAIRTGQGDVSQLAFEIDKLGTTSDSAAKLAASILDWLAKAEKAGKTAGGQFIITTDAARDLTRSMEEAKAVMSSPWTINVDDAIKSIAALEKGIRAFQAERLGMKGSKLSDILSDFSPEAVKRAQDAYSSKGFGMALKALGIEIGSLTVEQEKNLNTAFRLQKQYDAEAKTTEAYRKALREAEKDHTSAYNQMENNAASYKSEVEQTEASIRSLQAQLATAPGDVFSREQAKILADYEKTLEKINEEAVKYANKKGISTEQARQLKSQKEIEAGLKRDLALREAQEKEEKRLADLAKDRYEFYKELEEITGQYGLSLQFQSEVIAAQVKELERLQIPQQYIDQWKQLKELQASKDWADGAVRGIMRFKAEASDTASQTEDAFNGLFSGIQSSTQSMWEDFLETGKLSLSSLKSVFKSFIAQLLNIAVMNPIIVQIAGSVQNSLWGASAGSALAGTAQSGLGGVNIGGLTNLIPDSWTSGVSDLMTSYLPGTVTSTVVPYSGVAGTVMGSTGGAASHAGLAAAEAGLTGGNAGGGLLATNSAGISTSGFGLGSALGYGGWGALGYSTLGDMIGLPQSKYSGLTSGLGGALGAWGASAAGTAAGVAAGSTMGSVVPIVGTAIGAIAGGLLGSLLGGGRKTHASVYGKMEDVGFSRDAQTYSDAFMSGAWYDRAGTSEAQPFADTIGQAAATTAGTILDLAAALPDEYRKSVEDQLASATWSAGRGISGASWNMQWWKEGMAEERATEAINDMMAQMGYAANQAFADAGIGNLFDSFDLSNEEGLKKAANAVNSINTITTAIDQLKNPTTDVEAQATAFVEQIDALKTSVKSYGVNASYADALVEQYRSAYVDSYVTALDEMFNPLSEIEQQAQNYKTAIDGYAAALTTMGASEEQLAQVRGYTQTAIDGIINALDESLSTVSAYAQAQDAANLQIDQRIAALRQLGATEAEIAGVEAKRSALVQAATDEMVRSFDQTIESRRATLDGTSELVSLQQTQANELRSIIQQFGAESEQYATILRLQSDELAAFNKRQAEAAAAQQRSFYQNIQSRWATLNGTSDAVSRAISQENELREAVETFGEGSARVAELLRLQAAENAAAAVAAAQSRVDGLKTELAALEAQRVQIQQKAIQAEISSINEQLSAAKALQNTWSRLESSLEASRKKLWTGTNNISTESREKSAQREFDRLYKLALSGDEEAAGKLASAGDTLLALKQDTAANSTEYMDAFYEVEGKLKAVREASERQASAADKQVTALEKQLEAQQSQLDALNKQEETLESINEKISTVGQALADAIKSLQLAQSNPSYVGASNSTGGYVSWEDKLLAEKVASLNRGEYLTEGAPSSGWTPESAKAAMIKECGSVEAWYLKYGKAEGFAVGGLAMPGWAIVGERGPELVNFSTPGRVYTAEQTQRMLAQPACGTDGSSAASLAWMRERMDQQTEVMAAVYSVLTDIRQYERQTKEGIESMNENGVLATAKTSNIQKTKWAD